jgi:hypothetical protein
VSAATGIGPAELVDLDGPMFDALERAAGEAWPAAVELQAQTVDLLAVQLAAFVRAHSSGRRRLDEPRRVPRPEWLTARADVAAGAETRVGVLELAALTGTRITPTEVADV